MKVAAFILTTVLSVILMMGGVFVLLFTQDEPGGPALVALLGGATAFVIAGLFAGTFLLTSGRDPRSAEDRPFYRRVALVLGLVVVAGVAAMVTVAVLGEVSTGFAVAWIAVGLAYVAANVAGAEYLRRRDVRLRPTRPALPPVDADFSRRRSRTVMWWFGGVLVVGLVTVAIVAVLTRDASGLPALIGLAVSFAALAAMGVSLTAVFRINEHTRAVLGTDPARTKRIAGVVVRGTEHTLSAEETELARRYAPLAAVSLTWSTAQFSLLYLAILAQNLPLLAGDDGLKPLRLVVCGVLVVAAVVVPLLLRQRRRVERYREAHPVDAPAAA